MVAKRSAVLVIICVVTFTFGFVLADPEYFFKINKSIDIFGKVYRELALNYVDELDPERLMRSGIDGMLGTLDPYTTFIGEEEGDDIELLTSGKYGGIGVTIGVREGFVVITSTMDGYSAQRQGLQVGDRILEIEGVSMVGAKPDKVRSLTRGEPGTVVRMRIEREGEPKPLEFAIVREDIKIKNVSYASFLDDGIAYVKLDRFSRGAGDELRTAVKELRLKGDIKGLILDLRENPGGLLDAAVDVADKFLPQGSIIVSTRGRHPDSEKKYMAREEPMLKDEPMVVLVSRNSASASEIVAGAIQDMDRGVVLGTRTFGKGLVQTVTQLVYNTQLKITAAKYYTPSGRSIQEIDYIHKSKDGLFKITPDSLKREFKTAHGRVVRELGGISPDTVVEASEQSPLVTELLRKSMFFKFATTYIAQHRESPQPIESDEHLLSEFQKFLQEKNFTYEDPGEAKLRELREHGKKAPYSSMMIAGIDRLTEQLRKEKEKVIEFNKAEIVRLLKIEIASRYNGEKGRITASLADDVQVQTAKKLLMDTKRYSTILAGK
jgi:carboxyl-terminal processing protease